MSPRVIVAGATGLVGSAVAEHFIAMDREVIGLSRRHPAIIPSENFVARSIDLMNADACERFARTLSGPHELVYASLTEAPTFVDGWRDPDQMEANSVMLSNLVESVMRHAKLTHVTIFQGTKAYGSHLHPIRIPSKESEPRDDHPNFYWLQEDYIRESSRRLGFTFTILRPQLVIGGAIGAWMNVVPAIGAFAAIQRELGAPSGFPGGPPFVWEAVDARLLAECCEWSAIDARAHGRTFNVTNGDVFAWRDLWPGMMETLGVEAGAEDQVRLLAPYLAGHGEVWDGIVKRHGLRPYSLSEILGKSHHMADYAFATALTAPPPPKFLSTIAIRQAGFSNCYDTEESFRYWLERLMAEKVLPPAPVVRR